MTSQIAQWTLDVQDADRMAASWSRVLGYEIDPEGNEFCILHGP